MKSRVLHHHIGYKDFTSSCKFIGCSGLYRVYPLQGMLIAGCVHCRVCQIPLTMLGLSHISKDSKLLFASADKLPVPCDGSLSNTALLSLELHIQQGFANMVHFLLQSTADEINTETGTRDRTPAAAPPILLTVQFLSTKILWFARFFISRTKHPANLPRWWKIHLEPPTSAY